MGHDAAGLHRVGHQALVEHALRDHHFGLRKRAIDGAVVHLAVGRHAGPARDQRYGQVVGERLVDHDRLAGHRQLGIDHHRQRIVVDDDRVGRVTGDIAIGGHHHRHRLAGVTHDVDGHGAVIGRGEGRADRHRREQLGDLRAGEDRLDTLHRLGGAGVDRRDAAVGDVAALEGQVLHAGDLQVVDVGASTLDEARILAALDALADELGQDGCGGHGLSLRARAHDRVDDVLVAGAAAEIAGDALADLVLRSARDCRPAG